MELHRSSRQQLLRSIVASTVGTSIEWYDFFLYNSAAALVFARLYFPKEDPVAGVLLAFGTYFVGFFGRPIGAAIFGHFGDRIGRKGTLIATLLTMGLATTAIGLVPGYDVIGIWGGVLLTLLRVLQGIGVGGEWGGSVLLAMEWGGNGRRGAYTSWPQSGVAVGLILGNVALLMSGALSGPGFLTWGWRVPFLASAVMILIGLYIRLGILETPLFVRLLEERRIEPAPVTTVLTRNWKEIGLTALIRMGEQGPLYIFITFVLTYGTDVLRLGRGLLLGSVLLAGAVSLLVIPLAGYASDRFGRKRVYLIGILATMAFAFPYFMALNTRAVGAVVFVVGISMIPWCIQYGPLAAVTAETFTGRLRYSGASLGYQGASLIAGGPVLPVAAFLLGTFHSWIPISLYIVAGAGAGLVALALLQDRSDVDHTVEYDDQVPSEPAAAAEPDPAVATLAQVEMEAASVESG